MNYVVNIVIPSKIWGEQYETTHKSAALCVGYCEKPENGAMISIVHPVTGKTLDSVTYDGMTWKKPEKPRKTHTKPRKTAQKSDTSEPEQISLF